MQWPLCNGLLIGNNVIGKYLMRLKLYCCFECSELCIVFLVYHLHGPIKNRHGKKGLSVKQDGPGGGWDPGLDTTCAVFTIHYVVESLFAKHLNPILTWKWTKLSEHDLIAIIIGLKYVKTNHVSSDLERVVYARIPATLLCYQERLT